MIRIHREGRLIVILSSLILIGLNIISVLYLNYLFYYTVSFASVAIMILILRFFRVPNRRCLKDDRIIVAPADGKVVVIEKTPVDEFLDEERIQVSVFMSIHDVHVNYYPVDGRVVYNKYHPGKYLVARHPKSSLLNERYSVGIKNSDLTILIRQIAGFVARRIKCYADEGNMARQGEEFGFIKFGSRVDLFIPTTAEILVRLNESVTGGITPIARIK